MADGKRPAVAFELLGKKYGPVFSLKLGSTETGKKHYSLFCIDACFMEGVSKSFGNLLLKLKLIRAQTWNTIISTKEKN